MNIPASIKRIETSRDWIYGTTQPACMNIPASIKRIETYYSFFHPGGGVEV